MDRLNQIADRLQAKKTLSNGKEVTIKRLPAMKGIKMANKLLKVVLPALGGTLDGVNASDDVLNGTPRNFTHLAITICQQLDDLNVEEVILTLTEDMYIDGNPVEFDSYFASNYGELVEILEFALKENFSSFFMAKGISHRLISTLQGMMSQDTTLTQSSEQSTQDAQ